MSSLNLRALALSHTPSDEVMGGGADTKKVSSYDLNHSLYPCYFRCLGDYDTIRCV